MPKCRKPIKLVKNVKHPVWVRCKQCYYCRKIRRSSLVLMMILEHAFSVHSQFITLTFDPLFYDDPDFNPYDIIHYQKFIKRLRKNHKSPKSVAPIRYLIAGEHGGKFTKRWHYHMIIFNLPEPLHEDTWTTLWRLGRVDAGTVTPASMNYTAGYVTKMDFHEKSHKHHDPMDHTYAKWSHQIGVEGIKYIAKDFAYQGIVLPEYMYTLSYSGQQYLPTERLRTIFHEEYTRLSGIEPYKDNEYAAYIKQAVDVATTTTMELDIREKIYQADLYRHHMENQHDVTIPTETSESDKIASNPYLSSEPKNKIHTKNLQTLFAQDVKYFRENSHKHQHTPIKKRK